jgi:hypothetical protein
MFIVPYFNNGNFYIRLFKVNEGGPIQRTPEEIKENELDINETLGLDNHTMPIDNFPDPFISCCFIDDELVFVNLFHTATLTHHHFFYDLTTKEIS